MLIAGQRAVARYNWTESLPTKEFPIKDFEQCTGTYLKVVRFHEPSNPDGFIVLYLRPGGRFLFIGYWLGYENSVAAGYWSRCESDYHLQGFGRVRNDSIPCQYARFKRILKLEMVHETPTLTADEELKDWSLLSWVGPFTYIGERTVIPTTKELPDSLAAVDKWIDEIVQRTNELPDMSIATESSDSLWAYCTENNRMVPRPQEWTKLHSILANRRQLPSGGWEPPLPLILAAWDCTMPIEKHQRFREHIQWASDHNQLDEVGAFLRALPEEKWAHFGEI